MIGSITSGKITDLRDVAVARALSFTPFVGFYGRVIFMSSTLLGTRTFSSHNTEYNANYIDHNMINGKPISEFTGCDLDSHSYEIILNSALKIEPQSEVNLLKRMCDSGKPYLMFINGWIAGYFTTRSVKPDVMNWYLGRPSVIKVNLELKEHINSIPIEAVSKLRQQELTMSDTGVGGPKQISNPAAAFQERQLTNSINSITTSEVLL